MAFFVRYGRVESAVTALPGSGRLANGIGAGPSSDVSLASRLSRSSQNNLRQYQCFDGGGMLTASYKRRWPVQMQHLHTPPTDVTDSDLVQRALANDQDAFEILVNRYYSSIHNFAYSYLRDYDHAHDVSQHVFLKLYLSLSKIQT